MGLARRIIPCLDVLHGEVVKGTQFINLRGAGDPVAAARRYDQAGADELVLLDIGATPTGRGILYSLVEKVAAQITIPLTVGGGVRTADDFSRLLRAGADKVCINSAAVTCPELVAACAARFGSQCVVAAVDVKRRSARQWEVFTHGGHRATNLMADSWILELTRQGAGEILLTSIDADGTLSGFDLPLLQMAHATVTTPVIASGGGGAPAHFAAALQSGGASGALAASIFHDNIFTVPALKHYLTAAGLEIRLPNGHAAQ